MRLRETCFWIGLAVISIGMQKTVASQWIGTLLIVIGAILVLSHIILTVRDKRAIQARNKKLIESARQGHKDYLDEHARLKEEQRRMKESWKAMGKE